MPPKIPPKKPTIAQPKEQARVLFSYTAENDDELTIKEGDIINIIDKEIEDKGWMKGNVILSNWVQTFHFNLFKFKLLTSHSLTGELNGKIGVFPDNFITLITPSVPASKPVPANNFKPLSNSFHSSSNNSLNNGNGSADDSPPKLPVKKPTSENKLSKISSKFGDSIRDMIISKSNSSLNEAPVAAQKSSPLFLQQKPAAPNSDDLSKPNAAPSSVAPSLPLKKSKLFPSASAKSAFPKDEDSPGETVVTAAVAPSPNESSLCKSADSSSADLNSSMSSFIDEHNSSIKLTHLTKHRVQGPPRRPPSIIQINSKDEDSFDGLSDSGVHTENGKKEDADLDASISHSSLTQSITQRPAAKPIPDAGLNRQSFKGVSSSPNQNSTTSEMSTAAAAKATTPTAQPPWMVELKKTQAEKKNEVNKMRKNFSFDEGNSTDRGSSLLATASIAPSPVVSQPAAPVHSGSFNGTSPSTTKKPLQMPNSPTKLVGPAAPSATTSHRMSGDYSQRFKDFLQQNNSSNTNSLSRHSSVNNSNHSFNASRTLSTDSLTNDSKEPPSELGFGNLASPFSPIVKPVKAAKPTTPAKFMSGSPTATSNSTGNLLSSNLNNLNNHQTTPVTSKDTVSRKEFEELQKKVGLMEIRFIEFSLRIGLQ